MTQTDPTKKFPKPGSKESTQTYPGHEHAMQTKPDYGADSYSGSEKLSGKVALVTGGDSGIGRAIAIAYAKEGADVAITYLLEEEEDAIETVRHIELAGRKAMKIAADFRNEGAAQPVVEQVVKELGKLDVLVNNAGLQRYFKTLDDIGSHDFEEIYRVNVVSSFVLTQEAARVMKPGSSVINTVSIEAYEPDFLLLPYAASKGAFVALSKALAEELIKKGIRVNAVAPGPIWSPLNTHGSPAEKLKAFGEETLIGRPGQPVELSPVYVLLASDDASYITGEIYGVTGGAGIA